MPESAEQLAGADVERTGETEELLKEDEQPDTELGHSHCDKLTESESEGKGSAENDIATDQSSMQHNDTLTQQLPMQEDITQGPATATAESDQPQALSKEDGEGMETSKSEQDTKKMGHSDRDSDEESELPADGLGTQDEPEDVPKNDESIEHVQEEAEGLQGGMKTTSHEADEHSTSIENGRRFEVIKSSAAESDAIEDPPLGERTKDLPAVSIAGADPAPALGEAAGESPSKAATQDLILPNQELDTTTESAAGLEDEAQDEIDEGNMQEDTMRFANECAELEDQSFSEDERSLDSPGATGVVRSLAPVATLEDDSGNLSFAPQDSDRQEQVKSEVAHDSDNHGKEAASVLQDADADEDMFAIDVSTSFPSNNPHPNTSRQAKMAEDSQSQSPAQMMTAEGTTTVKVDFNDDEGILRDFLSRAKASKAARIAKRTSVSHRRDSGVVKQALASPRRVLEDLDKNSPSPRKTWNEALYLSEAKSNVPSPTTTAPVDAGDIDELAAAGNTTHPPEQPHQQEKHPRRSRRAATPKRDPETTADVQTANPAPTSISVRRPGDNPNPNRLPPKRTEAQENAMLTRTNTRRNKGGALPVSSLLSRLKSKEDTPQTHDFDSSTDDGNSNVPTSRRHVTWKPDRDLVSFLERKATSPPSMELDSGGAPVVPERTSSRPRAAKRATALGAVNGTPANGRTVYVAASVTSAPASQSQQQQLPAEESRPPKKKQKHDVARDDALQPSDTDPRDGDASGERGAAPVEQRQAPEAQPAKKTARTTRGIPKFAGAVTAPAKGTRAATAASARDDKENLGVVVGVGSSGDVAGKVQGQGAGKAASAGARVRRSIIPRSSSGRSKS